MKTRKGKVRNLVAKFVIRFHRAKTIDSKKRKAMIDRRKNYTLFEE